MEPASVPRVPALSLPSIFRRFLGFGFLAWGGPIAQIAMLRRDLVDGERWISSERFNRTLAVYQALPGPEAHELCVYFGYLARGRIGGLLAGLGFMLPGLVLMLAASWFYVSIGLDSPWVLAFFAGTQAAVLALVIRGIHRIGQHAVTDAWLVAVAVGSAVAAVAGIHFAVLLAWSGLVPLVARRGLRVVAGAAVVGMLLAATLAVVLSGGIHLQGTDEVASPADRAETRAAAPLELLGSGLKAGLLTFGGAYTAIPFLADDAESGGWLSREAFLDGVALAGILPAPLVIFATFLGFNSGGLVGALMITLGIFAPAFAITLIGHRHLERLVHHRPMHAVLDGVTAGVVGLVAATALSLAPAAVRSPLGVAIFVVALVALYAWRRASVVAGVMAAAGAAGLLSFALFGVVP